MIERQNTIKRLGINEICVLRPQQNLMQVMRNIFASTHQEWNIRTPERKHSQLNKVANQLEDN